MSQEELFSGPDTPSAREKWRQQRDRALKRVAKNSGRKFQERALAFVLTWLNQHGEGSAEDISLACKAAGIKPHDDRAFGPVYYKLSQEGKIVKVGETIRKRGHGTSGGNLWRLAA